MAWANTACSPSSPVAVWQVRALLILGLLGTTLATIAAVTVFVMWTLGTVYLLGRGIFASGHQFDGDSDFKWALFLLSGVIATVLGAWSRFKQPAGA